MQVNKIEIIRRKKKQKINYFKCFIVVKKVIYNSAYLSLYFIFVLVLFLIVNF